MVFIYYKYKVHIKHSRIPVWYQLSEEISTAWELLGGLFRPLAGVTEAGEGGPIRFVFRKRWCLCPREVWASVELANVGAFPLPGWSPRNAVVLAGHLWLVMLPGLSSVRWVNWYIFLVWHNLLPPSRLARSSILNSVCSAFQPRMKKACYCLLG